MDDPRGNRRLRHRHRTDSLPVRPAPADWDGTDRDRPAYRSLPPDPLSGPGSGVLDRLPRVRLGGSDELHLGQNVSPLPEKYFSLAYGHDPWIALVRRGHGQCSDLGARFAPWLAAVESLERVCRPRSVLPGS